MPVPYCSICFLPKVNLPGGCLWTHASTPCRPVPVPPNALVHFVVSRERAGVDVPEHRVREAIAACIPRPVPEAVEYLRRTFRAA